MDYFKPGDFEVGDKVSYTGEGTTPNEYIGRVGTVTKIDFDGMVFVTYRDGTLLAYYPQELKGEKR